ncbi:hypothetical protein DYB37_001366 [Aphanomyces astaci]|uniref:Uncharacterized protein n=1 Tax=Aphanomyces astaci TaxID=112090 RepID=A0A418F9K4_APHAT|nr:hypothetical protein DYB37_001366 [Aphanomyces astaci]
MHRRLGALQKLKALVDTGALSPKDATHRAIQMLESTPQPVRLKEPRLAKISNELLALTLNGSDRASASTTTIQGRLNRLIQEDMRMEDQFKVSDTVHLPQTVEASTTAQLRLIKKLDHLKGCIDDGSLQPLDAARRAMQILRSAPNDTVLDHLASKHLHDILHLVDDTRIRDSMHQQLEALQLIPSSSPPSASSAPPSTPSSSLPTPAILGDTVHFAKLYTAFDLGHHRQAFDLLAQITPAMWKRTPHANRHQVIKVSSMAITSMPHDDDHPVAAQHFLQFVQSVFRAKGLPLNWINQPTAIAAVAAASVQVHDSATLLLLYKSQVRDAKRAKGYFARRATTKSTKSTSNNAHKTILPPSTALFTAVVDTLGALHRQTALPEIIRAFPGSVGHGGLLALLRVLTLPSSAPHVVQLAASFPLQSFVDSQFQAPLLRAMLKVDLVVQAYDALLHMHTLGQSSVAKQIPSSVQTDILVELYKLKAFDRFHTAYDELWTRGYQVGLLEFRALSNVVPPAVLQTMLGRKEYRQCLQEAQRRASRQAQRSHEMELAAGLDLRAAPDSMCAEMLNLHLKALSRPEDVILFVSAANQAVVEAALVADGLSFVARHHHQLVVPAQSVDQVNVCTCRALLDHLFSSSLCSETNGNARETSCSSF